MIIPFEEILDRIQMQNMQNQASVLEKELDEWIKKNILHYEDFARAYIESGDYYSEPNLDEWIVELEKQQLVV